DDRMTITTVEKRLSIAYATAVAARAGCEISETLVDRNVIDVTVKAIRGTKVKIDLQLKATSSPVLEQDVLKFDLDMPEYNSLRSTEIQAPHLLVVLILPEDAGEWLLADELSLAFKKCAYWHNLYGMPEVQNKTSVRVSLPRAQKFHPNS